MTEVRERQRKKERRDTGRKMGHPLIPFPSLPSIWDFLRCFPGCISGDVNPKLSSQDSSQPSLMDAIVTSSDLTCHSAILACSFFMWYIFEGCRTQLQLKFISMHLVLLLGSVVFLNLVIIFPWEYVLLLLVVGTRSRRQVFRIKTENNSVLHCSLRKWFSLQSANLERKSLSPSTRNASCILI